MVFVCPHIVAPETDVLTIRWCLWKSDSTIRRAMATLVGVGTFRSRPAPMVLEIERGNSAWSWTVSNSATPVLDVGAVVLSEAIRLRIDLYFHPLCRGVAQEVVVVTQKEWHLLGTRPHHQTDRPQISPVRSKTPMRPSRRCQTMVPSLVYDRRVDAIAADGPLSTNQSATHSCWPWPTRFRFVGYGQQKSGQ